MLAPASAHAGRERGVVQKLRKALTQLVDLARRDEEPGRAVLHDLRQPAEPAADDGRPARHRLENDEAEQLGDRDPAAVARDVNGRERDDGGLPDERGELLVGHGPEEAHGPPAGEPPEELAVLALGRLGIVPARADDGERRAGGQSADEAVDALVRRQPSDEQDAAPGRVRAGAKPLAIHAAVDDARPRARRAELPRRILGDGEEAVKELKQQTAPRPALEAVVGDDGAASARASDERRETARRAPEVMRVDDVRARERRREGGGDGVCRMAEVRERAKDANDQAVPFPHGRRSTEGDELAVDPARESARELERVTLSTAEDPGRAEGRRGDVNDSQLVLCLVTVGDPRRLTGGYLYHLRMAEAAAAHDARIVFLSLPERPFPLAGLAAPRVLARARALGARALLLDSIAAAFAAPWLATRSAGLPLIGVLHQPPGGIDHGPMRRRLQGALDLLAYRKARLLVVASDLLADELAAAGVARERIRVVAPGRDVAVPGDVAHDLRRGRRAAFLCVANWVERKGILELLEALARLPPETATLHLVGDDGADARYAARVRRRLSAPDLAARVVVHGPLAREDVAALYAAADAFVLPALREPFGTVWGEAMAFGLPVVGWSAANLPYLAADGREGLLARVGDVPGLARALATLAEDEALRRRLGEEARRRAATRPTWEESAAAFFAAIREVVGQA